MALWFISFYSMLNFVSLPLATEFIYQPNNPNLAGLTMLSSVILSGFTSSFWLIKIHVNSSVEKASIWWFINPLPRKEDFSELPTHAKGDDWAFKNDL